MPSEEERIGETFTEAYAELCKSSIDLCVNVGIISSLMPRWSEEVQRNWVNELQSMGEKMSDLILVAQEFASGLD